jgi:hypothetical protein
MKRTAKYVGLDVHRAMTVATVRSEGGRVIARSVAETSDESIREFFSAMAGSVHVVLGAVALRPTEPSCGPCDRHALMLPRPHSDPQLRTSRTVDS